MPLFVGAVARARTKHGRPVCRFKSVSTRIRRSARLSVERAHMHRMHRTFTRFANTYRYSSSFLLVTLWTILLFWYEWMVSFNVFEHSFDDIILSMETWANVEYFTLRLGKFYIDYIGLISKRNEIESKKKKGFLVSSFKNYSLQKFLYILWEFN